MRAVTNVSRTPRRTWLALLGILLAGVMLRAHQVEWGLPDYFVADEAVLTAKTAEAVTSGPPKPSDFIYPHLQIRTVGALQTVTGQTEVAEGVRLGRWLNVAFGGGTLLLTFAIGLCLFGPRVALVATAFLAAAPYAVMTSHINGADGPLVFWVAASFLATALGFRSGKPGWLVVAGGLAGLAAAVKYPGFAAAVPAAWAALWTRAGSRTDAQAGAQRLRPLLNIAVIGAAVGAATALAFFAGCPRCVTAWEVCIEGVQLMGDLNYSQGAGAPLEIEGWLSLPYWTPLIATLPFSVGALSCAVAYLGLGTMARRAAGPALLIGAFLLPYFAVVGGTTANYPRYYLPMLPFLCLGAGFLSVRSLEWRGWVRIAGAAACAIALLHSVLVSLAIAQGFNERARDAVVVALTDRARALRESRRPRRVPTVGVHRFVSHYDGVEARLEGNPHLEIVAIQAEAFWVRKQGPDLIVVSEPFAERIRRIEASHGGGSFWTELLDETLGYERTVQIDPSFNARGLYATLDPLFGHAWTNGDIGFSIYERSEKSPRAPKRKR